MESKIKNKSKTEIDMEIEVSVEEFDGFYDRAVKEVGRDLEMPGFRKGSAPKQVVEERIGRENILVEAANLAIQENYKKAVLDNDIDVISPPKVDILKLAPGNPFVFKALVLILPDFDLPDYKKIGQGAEKKEISVEDKEIDHVLEWLQKSRAEKDGKTSEINDEFAKGLGNFDTLDKLKESIRSGLVLEKEQAEKQRFRNEILEKISKEAKIEIPDALIEKEQQVLMENFKKQVLSSLKTSFEDYLKRIKKTEEEMLESFKKEAEKRIRTFLILKEIAKKEKIEVSDEEARNQANEILKHYPTPKKAAKDIDFEQLKEYSRELIRNEKIFSKLESFVNKF